MADNKQDDEILGKAYDSKLMKRLLTYIKPYKKYVIIAILLNIFVASLGPLRPYLTKVAIDDYIVHANYHGLMIIALLLFGSLILQAVVPVSYTHLDVYKRQ